MVPSLNFLADEVRRIYADGPEGAPVAVEEFLNAQLAELPVEKQHQYLSQLKGQFAPPAHPLGGAAPTPPTVLDDEVLNRFCALLLGPSVSPEDLTTPEIMARLSTSLNTVFDILNQLIQAINATLFDGSDPEATIRHVISLQMAGENSGRSLEEYLGQIKTAFLTTQEAYKAAARTTVDRLLSELDPEALSAEDTGGFKFGRLRKGDYYDRYTQKYATCRKWFQSQRFMEDLLREFEKNCHNLAQHQRR